MTKIGNVIDFQQSFVFFFFTFFESSNIDPIVPGVIFLTWWDRLPGDLANLVKNMLSIIHSMATLRLMMTE